MNKALISLLFICQLCIFPETVTQDLIKPGIPVGTMPPDSDKTEKRKRTTMQRFTYVPGGVHDTCDWDALMCLRVYKTGLVCARTMYFIYNNFKNACEMDYVNCKLGIETWMVVHMGECINNKDIMLKVILSTDRKDETFLDRNYALSDLDFG